MSLVALHTEQLAGPLGQRVTGFGAIDRGRDQPVFRSHWSGWSSIGGGLLCQSRVDPAPLDMIQPIAAFGFAAVDHLVGKQVVVSGHLPDLRVHDDRGLDPHDVEPARSCGIGQHRVVGHDHILPPRLPNVPLQLDPQRAVIPEAVLTTVDFRALKNEPAPLAKSDDLLHPSCAFLTAMLICVP